ncbi:hypothetical protein K488DRAFT_88150 [Vararia minispora EC-137]|uniref:Uncharacterized protein n=1 Tax=Vararia minispora EC-137 TaxID=1314806 RepID=A0ACB8QDZ4_9AGAM|nr:hypothetical protein K488DRAFT_88150 [Vararia minispora EC-137]
MNKRQSKTDKRLYRSGGFIIPYWTVIGWGRRLDSLYALKPDEDPETYSFAAELLARERVHDRFGWRVRLRQVDRVGLALQDRKGEFRMVETHRARLYEDGLVEKEGLEQFVEDDKLDAEVKAWLIKEGIDKAELTFCTAKRIIDLSLEDP